jgi:large repetitive protein
MIERTKQNMRLFLILLGSLLLLAPLDVFYIGRLQHAIMSLASLKTTLVSRLSSVPTKEADCKTTIKSKGDLKRQVTSNATTFTDTDLAAYINASSSLTTKHVELATALRDANDTLASIIAAQAIPPATAPASLTPTAVLPNAVTVSFTNPSNTTSNTITAVPSSGTTVTATFTSGSPYTLSGLTSGKAYNVTVTASNPFGTTVAASLSVNTPSAYTTVSFTNYTTVTTPRAYGGYAVSADGTKMAMLTGDGLYYSTYSGGSWSTAVRFDTTTRSAGGTIRMNRSGTNGFVLGYDSVGLAYTFTWTGSIPSALTAVTSVPDSPFSYKGMDITDDGNRVIIVQASNPKVQWSASPFTTWNTVSVSGNPSSVAVSPDGNLLVYASSSPRAVYWAIWNGSTYVHDGSKTIPSVPTALTIVNMRFDASGTIVFMFAINDQSYYASWNPSTSLFNSAVQIPTTAIYSTPTNPTAVDVTNSSIIYGGNESKLCQTNLTFA